MARWSGSLRCMHDVYLSGNDDDTDVDYDYEQGVQDADYNVDHDCGCLLA